MRMRIRNVRTYGHHISRGCSLNTPRFARGLLKYSVHIMSQLLVDNVHRTVVEVELVLRSRVDVNIPVVIIKTA